VLKYYSQSVQTSFLALVSVFSFIFNADLVKAQDYPSFSESSREQKKPETKNSPDFSIKVGGGLGYEQVNKQGGFSINGSLNANLYDFTASVEIVDLFFYGNGGNSGYYTDTFSNGQSRCRSASNGQFATTSSCSPNIGVDVKFLRNADLSYGFPIDSARNKIFFGAGIPITDNNRTSAYGVFGYQSSSGGLVKAKVGNDTLDIRIGF
jgi:hypothetical protein